MRISEKELGLSIIYLSSVDTRQVFYKGKIPDKYKNLSLVFYSPISNNGLCDECFPSSDLVDYFEENFSIIEIEKLGGRAPTTYSEKYTVWFEVEEDIALYFKMKFSKLN